MVCAASFQQNALPFDIPRVKSLNTLCVRVHVPVWAYHSVNDGHRYMRWFYAINVNKRYMVDWKDYCGVECWSDEALRSLYVYWKKEEEEKEEVGEWSQSAGLVEWLRVRKLLKFPFVLDEQFSNGTFSYIKSISIYHFNEKWSFKVFNSFGSFSISLKCLFLCLPRKMRILSLHFLLHFVKKKLKTMRTQSVIVINVLSWEFVRRECLNALSKTSKYSV